MHAEQRSLRWQRVAAWPTLRWQRVRHGLPRTVGTVCESHGYTTAAAEAGQHLCTTMLVEGFIQCSASAIGCIASSKLPREVAVQHSVWKSSCCCDSWASMSACHMTESRQTQIVQSQGQQHRSDSQLISDSMPHTGAPHDTMLLDLQHCSSTDYLAP